MADFAEGRAPILISTTVIEVGVDVPEAAVMVIMDGHMFGMSQLHQLPGRIGREAAKGSASSSPSRSTAVSGSPPSPRPATVSNSRNWISPAPGGGRTWRAQSGTTSR